MLLRHLCFVLLCFFAACAHSAAQDCKSEAEIPSTTPAGRFLNHGDGTVTDTATGLMWTHCPDGLSGMGCATGTVATFTWEEALTRARDSDLAGYTDWRLPNVKELISIVEERCTGPAINLAVFPNTPLAAFRSTSPYGYSSSNAWYVHFSYGSTGAGGGRASRYPLRLVRSGQ